MTAFLIVFYLTVAAPTLPAFYCCGVSQPPNDLDHLRLQSVGWVPHDVPIQFHGHFQEPRSGVADQSLRLHLPPRKMKQTLNCTIQALFTTRKSFLRRSWSSAFTPEGHISESSCLRDLLTFCTTEIWRRSKNLKTLMTAKHSQPNQIGVLEYQRFPPWSSAESATMYRILAHRDPWTRIVVKGLCARNPHHSMYSARPHWVSSLLSFYYTRWVTSYPPNPCALDALSFPGCTTPS